MKKNYNLRVKHIIDKALRLLRKHDRVSNPLFHKELKIDHVMSATLIQELERLGFIREWSIKDGRVVLLKDFSGMESKIRELRNKLLETSIMVDKIMHKKYELFDDVKNNQ